MKATDVQIQIQIQNKNL